MGILVVCCRTPEEGEYMTRANSTTIKVSLLSCLAALLLAIPLSSCSPYTNDLGEPTDAGDADTTWTVLVYMCGSDLESEAGLATENLIELTGSDLGKNVNFVIETGGARKWRNNVITSKKIERYVAEPEGIAFVEDKQLSSMGDPSTLADFISWGVKKYPADKTMLIFWDHGGGTLTGVCADELYVDKRGTIDTLTLPEMNAALKKANHKFDIIGFDTCLMATLETAQAVAPWGDYLVASEETEPGGGWAYDTWPAWLAQYPGMSDEELARGICDSYYFKCVSSHTDHMATLSVTDLSKIDALAEAFDAASAEIFNATSDVSRWRLIAQGAMRTENYGGNTQAQGFTDMVDLGNLMQNTNSVLSPHAGKVIDALDDAVVYSINGSNHINAHGLSVFFPLALNEEVFNRYEEITDTITGNVAYLQFLAVKFGNYHKIDWTKKGVSKKEQQKVEPVESSNFKIKFRQSVDADYHLRLEFTSGFEAVSSVRFQLGRYDTDDSAYWQFGTDNNINADWEKGVFTDNFDGTWLAIDGNFLNAQLVNETEEYNLYAIPINLNGARSNLIAVWRYDQGRFEILGAYDGIDEASGTAGKGIHVLKDGDEITTLFVVTDIASGEPVVIDLATFTWKNGMNIEDTDLGDGDYLYRYEIEDLFGNVTYSDPVLMHYQDGNIEVEEL